MDLSATGQSVFIGHLCSWIVGLRIYFKFILISINHSIYPPPLQLLFQPIMLEETVKKLSDTLHGKGTLTFAANTPFSLIASSGSSKVVHIYNLKNAQLLEQLIPKSSTPVSFLAWDKTGKLLVIIQKDSPIIMVWNKTSKKATHIDLKLKELIFAKFSDDSKEIAVGTSRGTLLIYNLISDTKYTSTHNGVAAAGKKIPINCGDWSNDKFVYASEDGMISGERAKRASLVRKECEGD